LAKEMALSVQNTASFCQHLILTSVLRKTPIFFAENWRKSQKIAIITLIPAFDIKIVKVLGTFKMIFSRHVLNV
jgi:hypothetical protein